MPDELILHKKTRLLFEQVLNNPPHSLLIVGDEGSGKRYLSTVMALKLLSLNNIDQVSVYPYVNVIDPKEGKITIEQIRELKSLMNLKVPDAKKRAVNRISIIIDADRMKSEAQNALLKTLEEPPESTMIILTVSSEKALLSTITSRTSKMFVHPVSLSTVIPLFKTDFDEAEIKKAHALSRGNVALMLTILNKDNSIFTDSIELAKKLLKLPLQERLSMVDVLSKNKIEVSYLIESIKRISSAGLQQALLSAKRDQAKKWHSILSAANKSSSDLRFNVNTKLILDNLFINL